MVELHSDVRTKRNSARSLFQQPHPQETLVCMFSLQQRILSELSDEKETEQLVATVCHLLCLHLGFSRAQPDRLLSELWVDSTRDKLNTGVEGASFQLPIETKSKLLGHLLFWGDSPKIEEPLVKQTVTLIGVQLAHHIERKAVIADLEFREFALNHAEDIIFVCNEAGQFVYVNNTGRRAFALAEKTVSHLYISDFFLRLDTGAPLNWQDLQQEMDGRKSHKIELKLKLWQKRQIPVEVSFSNLAYREQNYHFGFARDITERKQNDRMLHRLNETLTRHAQELARSNADLEQFAYVASHDLQEPLRMVANYTSLLRRQYRGRLDDEADEFIDFACDGARRMQTLLGGLLAYSRVGTRGGNCELVHCGEVLESVLLSLRAVFEDTAVEFECGPLPTLRADRTQIHQLLQNLIENALKYRRPEVIPRVSLTAQRVNNEWKFALADNGIGISSEYFSRIFLIFQRLHTRADYPGTGIGLALCKKIVERHGGRIWLTSKVGEGTTFFFTLPIDH